MQFCISVLWSAQAFVALVFPCLWRPPREILMLCSRWIEAWVEAWLYGPYTLEVLGLVPISSLLTESMQSEPSWS